MKSAPNPVVLAYSTGATKEERSEKEFTRIFLD
jgi:hypothetical protein